MAKQPSRKKKSAAKSKRKPRSMAAHARADDVLRQQPAEPFPTPVAWLGLMGKNATAFADLQMRLTRCRSPMDLWAEQMRYIKGRIDDANDVLKGNVR